MLLLIFLVTGKWIRGVQNKEEQSGKEPHAAQIEKLSNVWVLDVGEEAVLVYRDGVEEEYFYGTIPDGSLYQPDGSVREQVADVLLSDGRVINVDAKQRKVHGKILGADENTLTVQGYGKLPLASDYRGYRIYGTLAMCTYRDLAFGYDFADLVLEDGEVCAMLFARDETMDEIRVLIRTSDFARNVHEKLIVTSDTDYIVSYRNQQTGNGTGNAGVAAETDDPEILCKAGEEFVVTAESDFLDRERIRIRPVALTGKMILKNVRRSQGMPGYRGELELIRSDDGFVVVNTLPLEDYLYSVVPSEMPASYGLEALKAQAVCARTYAYGHMLHAAYPAYGAHVDDSTAYQVYNNCPEQESTTRAVKETHGKLLYAPDNTLAETYYYSTSCGIGTDAGIWKTEAAEKLPYLRAGQIREETSGENEPVLWDENSFEDFITRTDPDDFEADEEWYRWTYCVGRADVKRMSETLKKRYQVRPDLILTKEKGEFCAIEPEDFSVIKNILVSGRGGGGVADELILETDRGTYKVMSEYNIRAVLCNGVAKVQLAGGRLADMPSLLPSGFFVLKTKTGKKSEGVIGYTVIGGGFGHGVGMSQNAAKHMAEMGYDHERILRFFYKDCLIKDYVTENVL